MIRTITVKRREISMKIMTIQIDLTGISVTIKMIIRINKMIMIIVMIIIMMMAVMMMMMIMMMIIIIRINMMMMNDVIDD